jgi:hypothetical protein
MRTKKMDITPQKEERLRCQECGKSVSTVFFPVPTDTPDGGIIVRAIVMCPECFEKVVKKIKEES